MLTRVRSRLTYANVMSTIAVCFALGGGVAYAANTVFSEDIVDGEVKSVDLATNSVTGAKLGSQSVNSKKILDGSVALADLAPDSVDSSKVLDESLTASDLGPNSVGSAEIQTDAVQATEIADDSIDGGEIIDNSLGGFELQDGTITSTQLGADSVGASEIAAGAVGASEVENDSLTSHDLAGGFSNGAISLPAGYVANGQCRDGVISIIGGTPGDAVIFSLKDAIPQGVLITGVRVPAAGQMTIKTCNLSGGAFPAINNVAIAAVTLTL